MTPVCRALVHYRFGSIQVFTGAIPFSTRSTVTAIMAVTQGERPPRPTHSTFTTNLWVLTQRCWDQLPHLRPETSEVSEILLTMSVSHPYQQSSVR